MSDKIGIREVLGDEEHRLLSRQGRDTYLCVMVARRRSVGARVRSELADEGLTDEAVKSELE
jgi:hypothetical protein